MKILMVTAEAVPFAKTGGLADMVSALSLALQKAGHDVRIVMPRFYAVDRGSMELLEGPMGVPLGRREAWTAVYASTLHERVPVYFIDYEEFYGRDGVYGTPAESDFHDNPLRFSLLCNGAFRLCGKIGWFPDIVHAHDWSSAPAMPILRYRARRDGAFGAGFAKTAGVFTIHNLGYQGVYPKDFFPSIGLDWNEYYSSGFEERGRLNFIKAGISSADALTTVSPTYAREIQSAEGGFGLDWLLRIRGDSLHGILNGVDTEAWNPATDSLIAKKYTARTVSSGKAANKRALRELMGLENDDSVPVFGVISRLTDQKGVAELFAPTYGCMFDVCAGMKIQAVVLGSGEGWCERELRELERKLPNLKVKIGFDEKLSHLIEAGSDFFIMPSRYEPCGLNQMYSLLYGTLPIVRRTGGLADTVRNYDEETGDGTGFMFDLLTPRALYDTIGWAVWAWYNRREHIVAMRKRAMGLNFGWELAAERYAGVYESALERI